MNAAIIVIAKVPYKQKFFGVLSLGESDNPNDVALKWLPLLELEDDEGSRSKFGRCCCIS